MNRVKPGRSAARALELEQSVRAQRAGAQGPSRIVYAPLDYCQIAAARNRSFACCAQNRRAHTESLCNREHTRTSAAPTLTPVAARS